jgi:transcriptional regulator with XRE-family HTH domain
MPASRPDISSRPERPAGGEEAPPYEAYVQELSRTLQRLRRRCGLSQEAVAHAAGLTAYTYQKFEHGESRPGAPMNPGLKTLVRLSRVFGVSVTELLPAWVPDLPPDPERARSR